MDHGTLALKELLGEAAWGLVAVGPERELDNFAGRAQLLEELEVRIVRGANCSTKKSLFSEWAAALQFPWYFGYNWDAFDECLLDLEWIDAETVIVAVSRVDDLLKRDSGDMKTLMAIIHKASASRDEEWAVGQGYEGPTMVRFVLQFESESSAIAHARQFDMSVRRLTASSELA